MTHIDWCNSVDELVQDKVRVECIKSLVLQSLEGPPKDMARLANKRGKGTLADILLVLDKAYGRSGVIRPPPVGVMQHTADV